MRIKFIRNCRGYEKGKVIDVDYKVGQRFIIRGFARLVPQRGGVVKNINILTESPIIKRRTRKKTKKEKSF